MIVQCEQCQTRFKIPDEKVTEKGVKVRCTKCQNTFRVAREPAPAVSAPPPAPTPSGQADPFQAFGEAPPPTGEVTRPGAAYYGSGGSAAKGPGWDGVDVDIDEDAPTVPRGPLMPFDPPVAPPGVASRRQAAPAPEPARLPSPTDLAGLDFDDPFADLNEPPAAPPPVAARPVPPGAFAPPAPRAVPPGAFAPPPAAPPPSLGAPGTFDFGAFDDESTQVDDPMGMSAGGPSIAAPAPVAPAAPPGLRAAAPAPRAPAVAGTPPAGGGAAALGPRSPAGAPVPARGPAAGQGTAAPGPRGAAPAAVAAVDVPGLAPVAPVAPAAGPRGPGPAAVAAPAARGPTGGAAPQGPVAATAPAARGPTGGAAPQGPVAATAPAARGPMGGAAPQGPGPAAAPGPRGGAVAPPAAQARGGAVAPPAAQARGGMAPPAPAPGRPVASGTTPLPLVGGTDASPDPLFDFPLDAPAAPNAVSLRQAANAAAAPVPSGASAMGAVAPSQDLGGAGFENDDPFASIDTAAPASSQDMDMDMGMGAPVGDGAAPEALGDLFDFSGAGASGGEGLAPSDAGRSALLGDVPAEAGADEPGGISLLGDVPAYDDGDPFKITTPRREVVDLASMRGGPAVTVTKPSARPEDVGMPQRRLPGRARKLTGLVLNVTIAAALVVTLGALGAMYLRDGKVDPSTLSPDRLRTLLLPASRPFIASDVSNGLYETRDGHMLFVVRGEAENRTRTAQAVRVRAALYDGDQRVRSAEGLVGTLATPEDLHAVTTGEAATALRLRLDASAPPVPPGGKAPFLVVFQEFPADLSGFRLEVSLEPVVTETTADRTKG
jgi:predicted Zn finger-like uncharacterized protein